jgi:RNA exonuclease 4
MGGKAFFTKKQKAQMRERRKKQRVLMSANDQTNENDDRNNEIEPFDEAIHTTESKKRPRSESFSEPATTEPSITTNQTKVSSSSAEIVTKTVQGKLHVLVPSSLSTKDAKKFRKDARRKLRLQVKDDESIEFVVTDDPGPPKKKTKKKKIFPSIQELLQQKRVDEKQEKEEKKLKKKIQEIPESLKAKYIALDCEMVGIGADGKKSALARVSLVDWNGEELLDSFVKVPIRVTDFRTHVSGVEPKHIKDSTAMELDKCRELVASLMKDKILVGHALTNDLKALFLTHPKSNIRDTAKFRPFQRYANGKWRPRKLRDLVKENLKGKEGFQEAEHDSVQDARATMELFQLVQSQWEKEVANKVK